jgi:hypothetical protein
MFSPVLIDVEANGRRFAEMHVDGGVTHNIFILPDPILASRNFLPNKLSGEIFVIVNDKVAPDFEAVEDHNLTIVVRSLSTMVKASTNRVLLSTYQFARSHGLGFNLAAIDPSYPRARPFSSRTKVWRQLPPRINAAKRRVGSRPPRGGRAPIRTMKRAPLADYRVVYFATHGLVAGDIKGLGEPSLLLSLPKQPSDFDDGLLGEWSQRPMEC